MAKHPHTAKYTTLLLIVFVNQAVAAAIAFSIALFTIFYGVWFYRLLILKWLDVLVGQLNLLCL